MFELSYLASHINKSTAQFNFFDEFKEFYIEDLDTCLFPVPLFGESDDNIPEYAPVSQILAYKLWTTYLQHNALSYDDKRLYALVAYAISIKYLIDIFVPDIYTQLYRRNKTRAKYIKYPLCLFHQVELDILNTIGWNLYRHEIELIHYVKILQKKNS